VTKVVFALEMVTYTLVCVVGGRGFVSCAPGVGPKSGPSVRVASDIEVFSLTTTGKVWSWVDVDRREVIGGGFVRCVSTVDEVTGVMGTTGTTFVVFMGTSPIVCEVNVDLGPDSLGIVTF